MSESENHSEKTNRLNKFPTIGQIIGIAGVVVTIIFGINQWKERSNNNAEQPLKSDSINQEKQDNRRTIEVRDKGTYIEGNQTNIYKINNNSSNEVRKFQRNIPKSYLSQLPGIKANAYRDARELWNTGVTSEMMKGNYLVLDRLTEALSDLAETVYTPDFFNGISAKEYYSNKIEKMSKAAYDGQTGPEGGGTIGLVTGSDNLNRFVQDFIVEIVKDISEPSYFISWKKEWDHAGKKLSKEEEY
ncbi:hypothetical protein ATO12_17165 [Aquimarina atlantica]|uniref:Uncharacterized protein n=1 Tax=Aquimarina atlantica TaxID=1317122 RepID=A0A023BUI6_9FLAO|nr:hypothetical protein [Aquimarina atlantica]EZH73666.1 hypothetical protein ATO12_17165 [Aquimarina atlantica]